jgi:hypothetical protein
MSYFLKQTLGFALAVTALTAAQGQIIIGMSAPMTGQNAAIGNEYAEGRRWRTGDHVTSQRRWQRPRSCWDER